jgi:hypothetical protein
VRLRSRLAVGAMTAALITVPLMIGAGGASAAPVTHQQVASASAGGAQPSFAAQARSAGLTGTQIAELQKEVNAYIRRYGGTQVAINQVAFNGGNITFVVPGQRYAKAVTSSGAAAPTAGRRAGAKLNGVAVSATPDTASCPYLYFCAYKGTYFSGTKLEFYYCGEFYDMPWDSIGSWYNDQTEGDQATFYGADANVLYRTQPAPTSAPVYGWGPVYYVVPCPD